MLISYMPNSSTKRLTQLGDASLRARGLALESVHLFHEDVLVASEVKLPPLPLAGAWGCCCWAVLECEACLNLGKLPALEDPLAERHRPPGSVCLHARTPLPTQVEDLAEPVICGPVQVIWLSLPRPTCEDTLHLAPVATVLLCASRHEVFILILTATRSPRCQWLDGLEVWILVCASIGRRAHAKQLATLQ